MLRYEAMGRLNKVYLRGEYIITALKLINKSQVSRLDNKLIYLQYIFFRPIE